WAATGALLGIAVGLPALIRDYRSRQALEPAEAALRDAAGPVPQRLYLSIFILVAFFAAWLPFSRVPPGLFPYHMLGGLPPMFLALALALTYLRTLRGRLPGFAIRGSGALPAYAFLLLALGSFIYFYPPWSGLP